MSEFVFSGNSDELFCTFAVTGCNLADQAIMVCQTCSDGQQGVCCCSGCASTCHNGHDVNYVAYGKAYCDCGCSKCSLLGHSIERSAGKAAVNFQINDIDREKFALHYLNGLDGDYGNSLRNQCISVVKQSKETFWIGCLDSPRTMLEEFAQMLFQFHTSGIDCSSFDPALCGAEYWIQVKGCEESAADMEVESGYNVPRRGVDLHYDKDEELASLFGLGVFPYISTVTYLTEHAGAAPTIVLDTTVTQEVGSQIKLCYVSLPEVKKHISFDGRLLHGAPSQLCQFSEANYGKPSSPSQQSSTLRITLLVNVWIGHKPWNVSHMPPEIVSMLPQAMGSACPLHLQLCDQQEGKISAGQSSFSLQQIDITKKYVDAEGMYGEWMDIPFLSSKSEWGKSEDETGLIIHIWIPYDVAKLLNAANASALSKRKAGDVTSKSSITVSSTFLFYYKGPTVTATMDYEVDENEVADEFDGAMCGVIEK